MTDRPIIFSAPMVQALLAGRKTQTRRMLGIRGRKGFSEFGPSDTVGYDWHFRDARKLWHDLRHEELLARLPWQVGDRLWVRENCWADWQGNDGNGVRYPADGAWIRATDEERQLVPSIHMPRWAFRLTLTVTDVRVQRLQEISEEDALAEGIKRIQFPERGEWGWPQQRFRDLWQSIHGTGAWDANPHVVALTFTVERRNIDTP